MRIRSPYRCANWRFTRRWLTSYSVWMRRSSFVFVSFASGLMKAFSSSGRLSAAGAASCAARGAARSAHRTRIVDRVIGGSPFINDLAAEDRVLDLRAADVFGAPGE